MTDKLSKLVTKLVTSVCVSDSSGQAAQPAVKKRSSQLLTPYVIAAGSGNYGRRAGKT